MDNLSNLRYNNIQNNKYRCDRIVGIVPLRQNTNHKTLGFLIWILLSKEGSK